jgi:hypothetical protein
MISKDQSIVTQVAAKIASELTNTTAIPERTPEAVQSLYLSHYDFVCEILNNTHGFNAQHGEALLQQAFPNSEATSINGEEPSPKITSAPAIGSGEIAIAGKQHGDIPKWLVVAAKKAGVTRVWDNRDTAVGTRRPWFKQADVADGQEAVAFWPPRGAA